MNTNSKLKIKNLKFIVVLGAGESGVGAALLAQKQGYEVLVSDSGKIAEKHKSALEANKIRWEEGKHSEDEILQADEVIKSPGIPEKAELIKKLRAKGINIISEIEFGYRYSKGKVVAITGSNGKTTTTALTYHLLKKGGLDVALVGNIGYSYARQIAEEDKPYYVMEVSSFQLDDIQQFKPYVSILLNITPDHLDRYEYEFQNYIDAKFKIAGNQDQNDYFIFCADDEVVTENLKNKTIKAKKIPFSLSEEYEEGAFAKEDQMVINYKKKRFIMPFNELSLKGKHNYYNSMAAGIVARIFDLRKEVIRESLTDFQNLEHRLEPVAKVHGIEFINDSKATNVNSTWYALETMAKPVIWIVGGVDKGNDYSLLEPVVKQKVKAIVCLGKDNRKIHSAFSKSVDVIVNTSSAEEAVKMAYHLGKKGEIVLLSPACASFDLFENYEDRGRQFKKAVREL